MKPQSNIGGQDEGHKQWWVWVPRTSWCYDW